MFCTVPRDAVFARMLENKKLFQLHLLPRKLLFKYLIKRYRGKMNFRVTKKTLFEKQNRERIVSNQKANTTR